MKWVITKVLKALNQLKPHKILISIIVLSCLLGTTGTIAIVKTLDKKKYYTQKNKKVGSNETSIMMDLRKLGWAVPGVLLYKKITENGKLAADPEYRPTKIKELIHFDKNNTTFLKKEELEPLVTWIDKNENGVVDNNELYESVNVLNNIKESENNRTWGTLKNKGEILMWEGYKRKPSVVTSLTIQPKQAIIFPTIYTLFKENGDIVGYVRFVKVNGGIYAIYVPRRNNQKYSIGVISKDPIMYHCDNLGKEYITWENGTKFSFDLDSNGETLYGNFINDGDEKSQNDPEWRRGNQGELIARLTGQEERGSKEYYNISGADEKQIKSIEMFPYAKNLYIKNSPNFHYPKGKSIRTLMLETKNEVHQ
jgi:hypothetical protein